MAYSRTCYLFILSLVGAPALAATCTNIKYEISCHDGGCEFSNSFTPMSVTFDRQKIEICAYSGCFSGTVTARYTAGIHEFYSALLRRYDDRSKPAGRASLLYDPSQNVIVLRWGGFAMPMGYKN